MQKDTNRSMLLLTFFFVLILAFLYLVYLKARFFFSL